MQQDPVVALEHDRVTVHEHVEQQRQAGCDPPAACRRVDHDREHRDEQDEVACLGILHLLFEFRDGLVCAAALRDEVGAVVQGDSFAGSLDSQWSIEGWRPAEGDGGGSVGERERGDAAAVAAVGGARWSAEACGCREGGRGCSCGGPVLVDDAVAAGRLGHTSEWLGGHVGGFLGPEGWLLVEGSVWPVVVVMLGVVACETLELRPVPDDGPVQVFASQ